MVTFQMPVFSCPAPLKAWWGHIRTFQVIYGFQHHLVLLVTNYIFFFQYLKKKKSTKLLSVPFNDDDGFHYMGKFAVGSVRFGADNEVFVCMLV